MATLNKQKLIRRLIYFEFQCGRSMRQIARVLDMTYEEVQEHYRRFVLSHRKLTVL